MAKSLTPVNVFRPSGLVRVANILVRLSALTLLKVIVDCLPGKVINSAVIEPVVNEVFERAGGDSVTFNRGTKKRSSQASFLIHL
jgi:hypothetical protein